MHNLKDNFDRVLPIIQTLLENDVNEAGNVPTPGLFHVTSEYSIIFPLGIAFLATKLLLAFFLADSSYIKTFIEKFPSNSNIFSLFFRNNFKSSLSMA